ncbi:uncharacterized protein METZ01_LOCUS172459 [marine metagenome]|uniref:Uncharacterized protein n=1 Tax=marine metagenome TaxID=408172 RepID=A0A382C0J0_9ZZZZ
MTYLNSVAQCIEERDSSHLPLQSEEQLTKIVSVNLALANFTTLV